MDESNVDELIRKATVSMESKKFDEALYYFDELLKLNPINIDLLCNKGVALYYLNKFDDAISCYDKVLELKPNYVHALIGKGGALDCLNKFNEAILCFDRVLELEPNDILALNAKGVTLLKLNKLDGAISCYDKALKLKPNYVDALNGKNRALHGKCIALLRVNKFEDAILYCDKVLELDSNDILVLNTKCLALYRLHRFEDLILCCDKVLELDSNNIHALNGKGKSLLHLKKFKDANSCYDKILELNSNDILALNGKGDVLLFSNKFKEAVSYYNKILELEPNYIPALYNKGQILANSKKFVDAILCYNKILELDPYNIDTLCSRANAILGLQSIKLKNKKRKLDPDTSIVQKELYHVFDTNIWIDFLTNTFLNDHLDNKNINSIQNINYDLRKINSIKDINNIFIPAIVYKEAITSIEIVFKEDVLRLKTAMNELFSHWNYTKNKYRKMLGNTSLQNKLDSEVGRLKDDDFKNKLKLLIKTHNIIVDSDEYKGLGSRIHRLINDNKPHKNSKNDLLLRTNDKKIKKELYQVSLLESVIDKEPYYKLINYLLLFGEIIMQVFNDDTQIFNVDTQIHKSIKRNIAKKYNKFQEDPNMSLVTYKNEISELIKKEKIPNEINNIVNKLTPKRIEFYKEEYKQIGIPIKEDLEFKKQLVDDVGSCMAHPWLINHVIDRHILITAIYFGDHENPEDTEVIFHTRDKDYSRYSYIQKKLDIHINVINQKRI